MPTIRLPKADGSLENFMTSAPRQFAKPAPVRTIGMIWRKSSARRAAIEAVAQAIAAHALA